jgi:hypothetical protein
MFDSISSAHTYITIFHPLCLLNLPNSPLSPERNYAENGDLAVSKIPKNGGISGDMLAMSSIYPKSHGSP